jgi:hypothetical protein
VSDHTPSGSIFISNVSNRAWRNQLSSVSMDPHQEMRNMATMATTVATAAASTMMGRVKKRVLNVFLSSSLTSPTKKVAGKVHAGLARNDAAFTSVIDSFDDVQSSQEISSACFDLQRAMDA